MKTKFEKDMVEILEGNEIEVLERRRKELKAIEKKYKFEKNGFRRQCLAQEYARREKEYNALADMI